MAWPDDIAGERLTFDRLAHRILDVIGDFADLAEVDYPLPSRRYVSPGAPAWDADQLTVNLDRTGGHAGDIAGEVLEPIQEAAGWSLRSLTYGIHVVRCLPGWTYDSGSGQISRLELAGLPPIEVDEQLATLHNSDPQFVLAALRWGTTTERLPGTNSSTVGRSQSVPDGDMVGQIIEATYDLAAAEMIFRLEDLA